MTYLIPDFYLSYIFNGDDSGLNQEEKEAFDKFAQDKTKNLKAWHFACDDPHDSSFHKWHDMTPYGILACDCVLIEIVEIAS